LVATQAALALADVHNFDKEGLASVAHADIAPSQYVLIDGVYKLNDFNRARFLRWDASKGKPCPFTVGSNPGKNRSPEEYAYMPETEKIDVYSLGNIFYMLLQEEWPFEDVSSKVASVRVIEGTRPTFYADVWNSTHPVDVALKTAMLMCHVHNPKERSTARAVAVHLTSVLETLDPGRLAEWLKHSTS
jgi:serine/threonine protein kinase